MAMHFVAICVTEAFSSNVGFLIVFLVFHEQAKYINYSYLATKTLESKKSSAIFSHKTPNQRLQIDVTIIITPEFLYDCPRSK